MERVHKQNGESGNVMGAVQAKFTSKSRETERENAIDNSPAMIAQRKKLQGLFGGAVQRQGAEDEMLQGKFETAQRVEEEEPLQGKFEAAQRVEEEEPLQGKFETAQRVEEEEPLQGKFEAASSTQLKEEVDKPNNTGLPDNLKSGIESLSGMSMNSVKVHYNSSQPAQLNALAYAQGTDIHVAPGQEQHLPHEAWHVVQQAQGRVKPTMQMKEGVPVNDDKSLEHEADVMGAKAVQMQSATTPVAAIRQVDSSSAPIQRVKWLYTGNGWVLQDTLTKKQIQDGLNQPPKFAPSKKNLDQLYDTKTQEWEIPKVTEEKEEVGYSMTRGGSGNKKGDFIGDPREIHIHIVGTNTHLKIFGKKHFFDVNDKKRMQDVYQVLLDNKEYAGVSGYRDCSNYFKEALGIK